MDEVFKSISEFLDEALGPLGSKGFSLEVFRDVFIQLGSLLILFIAVRIFFWKPITKFIEERQKTINEEITNINKEKEAIEKLKKEHEIALLEVKEDAKKIIKNAQDESEKLKQVIINDANSEAARKIQMAHEQIESEWLKKEQQVKEEIVNIALLTASVIVDKEISNDQYAKEIAKSLKESKN